MQSDNKFERINVKLNIRSHPTINDDFLFSNQNIFNRLHLHLISVRM